MYAILAVAGWIWAAVFFAVLAWRLLRERRHRRSGGFEVVSRHDQQR
jgi:hypothetical protein